MTYDSLTAASVAALLALVAAVAALLALRTARAQRDDAQMLRVLAEQALAGQRAEAETIRRDLGAAERALRDALQAGQAGQAETFRAALAGIRDATGVVGQVATQMRTEIGAALVQSREAIEARVREMREGNEKKLAEIQKTVDEQLHAAVEKQMTASFARVVEQFTAVQQAIGDVQAVTAQIGDIKRLFGNVKTRGGWGEAQVAAMLDDILPPGSWERNYRPRPDSAEVVEFAVIMPGRGETRPRLPVDSKFPVADYERLLAAADLGDAEGERVARGALERRLRDEARRIAEKYIVPPATVEFAVMYLPTDGLYAEAARIPGLIDDLGRAGRVLVLGPTLFPALLRTIQLGHVTLSLEQKVDEVRHLLGATRSEMLKLDDVLERLGKQAGTIGNTVDAARRRTRAIDRKLRGVEVLDATASEVLLGTEVAEAEAADAE